MTKTYLTASQAKKIWLRTLFRHMNNSVYDEYLETIIPHLQALKFTNEGEIRKERHIKGKGMMADKNYLYIKRHFPALLKRFEEEVGRLNANK